MCKSWSSPTEQIQQWSYNSYINWTILWKKRYYIDECIYQFFLKLRKISNITWLTISWATNSVSLNHNNGVLGYNFFSSPELKARWAIAIAFRPSGVNFLQFHFLRNRWADINQLGGDHPWGLGPKVIFMWSMWRPGRGWSWGEGPQRKKGGKTLKIFFSGPQSSTDYICFCIHVQ